MRARFRVTRTVTTHECPWLTEAVLEGTEVFEYRGADYGCINWLTGIAVTRQPHSAPFFEVPRNAVEVTP